MKIETAIRLLTRLRDLRYIALGKEFKDALSLGIEALKFYQETRPAEVSTYCPLLPDETKED